MGRTPYPAALRLVAIAEGRWPEVDAAYLQVELLRLPFHRFLNAIYTWCLERIDPEKIEDWKMMLSAPLPGSESRAPTPEMIEQEGSAFMALMAATGGGADGT